MSRMNLPPRVAAVAALVLLASCERTHRDVLGPGFLPANAIFQSYVAIGNSITAGYQSGGINDSTQKQSYARLIAGSMGTQYHYPSLNMPGCSPPIANTQTGALVGGAPPGFCALRAGASVTDILNNVGVPGARVLDPTSSSTVASNALTQFILGGKTQVQRALDAHPTFVSIWIGNNDVLVAGLTGQLVPTAFSPGIVSTQAQFQASFDLMIKQLLDSMPGLKGVLIGVVQVSGVPSMSLASLVASTPAVLAAINAATGKSVTILPTCTGSTALIDLPQMIPQIKSGALPPVITCDPNTPGLPAPIGDLFILDPTEQATLSAAINGYNSYIQQKAAAIGFAYYDPNPTLAAQKATGAIPPLPNFGSATATFGTLFSLDGVHPSAAGHVLLANGIIAAVNAKYGTTLANVQ